MTAAKPLRNPSPPLDASAWRAILARVPVEPGEPTEEELEQIAEWERGGRVMVDGADVSAAITKLAR